MGNTNPYGICTWDDEVECLDCELRFELGCRLDMSEFQFFIVNQIPNLTLAVFGLVLVRVVTGAWWPLIAFGAACIVLWVLGLETRVLCSHCPYWAEESKTLHCWALTGSPKIWRYRPGPLAAWEKATFLAFLSFLLVFPPIAEGYAIWTMAADGAAFGVYALLGMVGVTLATILTGAQFFYILKSRFCTRCVNFSCPLNHVPQAMVDTYLAHNPVMREAWEKSGYRLELSPEGGSNDR
jgi:hypothetical protein